MQIIDLTSCSSAARRDSSARFRGKRTLATSDRDRDVVARAKAGDREAVGDLYALYADNVYGYVRAILRNEHEAEDVTQQVFAKLLTAVGRYEQRRAPFSAWILRIAYNAAMDQIRDRRAVACEEVPGVERSAEDSSMHGYRSLHAALEELPEQQRRVVVMRHVVGLSPPEIAQLLGKSENAVHGLHHRGRRALRAQLAAMGSAPKTLAA